MTQESFQDIRDAVRQLCEEYPADYWRKLDREKAYPSAFVNAPVFSK